MTRSTCCCKISLAGGIRSLLITVVESDRVGAVRAPVGHDIASEGICQGEKTAVHLHLPGRASLSRLQRHGPGGVGQAETDGHKVAQPFQILSPGLGDFGTAIRGLGVS